MSVICSMHLCAQDTILLQLNGNYSFNQEFEKIIMHITFEANNTTCGPNSNFEDIHQQYAYFLDHLEEYDLNADSFHEINSIDKFTSNRSRITLKYTANDKEESRQVNALAKEAFAQQVDFYLQFTPLSIEDEKIGVARAHEALNIRINSLMNIYDAKHFEIESFNYSNVIGLQSEEDYLSHRLESYSKVLTRKNTFSINAKINIW